MAEQPEGSLSWGSDGCLKVRGALTFATVVAVLQESQAWFAEVKGPLAVDLGGVARADSAGLALLIEWLREARRVGKAIAYYHVPEQLLAIARASDLEGVLPLATRP